jgi:Na+/H+-translocating membrane pyrophosphatase
MNYALLLIFAYAFLVIVGDLLLQDQNTRLNKSRKNSLLLVHTVIYTLVLLFLTTIVGYHIALNEFSLLTIDRFQLFYLVIIYSLINGVIHFCTDYVTSRSAKYYYDTKQYWSWMNVIIIDQVLHFLAVSITFYYLFEYAVRLK